ncbi:MAG: M23 family metallopeptidase [Bacilli bacterium]|nr:M23 family metallopeptidase [Bacilli bacterium]
MTKEKIKFKYVPVIVFLLVLLPIFAIAFLFQTSLNSDPEVEENVNENIVDTTLPVINTTIKPVTPYTNQNVKIIKTYYDYLAEEDNQLNSIIRHDDTYIQNTGIDYGSDDIFDVVAILDGTVEKVSSDATTGKMVEIKHNDNSISIYGSLSEVSVKKGDIVNMGQQIGKSGSNELDKDLGNHLHFEVYNNGQNINPETYLNTEQKIKREN